MNDDAEGSVEVTEWIEHEDGSATFSYDADPDEIVKLSNIGLKFLIYCAAYNVDTETAFDMIASQAKKETDAL